MSDDTPPKWDAVVEERMAFNNKIDEALDQAHADLRAAVRFRLPAPVLGEEMEILHELMFKLGMARSVLIHGDATPERAEQLWQEDKARRRATLARMAPPPRPKP